MPILSYKAGRANRRSDDSNWVDPSPEKGTLEFELMDDLAQLVWTSRETGSATEREEYLLFPDDVHVEKVASDATGRTYVFKFSSSDQRLFYWFQDADATKYDRFARTINSFLQNPDSFPGESLEPAPMPDVASAASISIQAEAPAPSGSHQVPITPAPASTVTDTVPATPAPKRVTGIRDAPEDTPSAAQTHQFSEAQLGALAALLQGSRAAGGAQEDANLGDILTPQTITPILLANPSLINRLQPFLPSDIPLSSPPTPQELHDLFSAPQWTEAVRAFDAALRTGGLAGIFGGLGLGARAGDGVKEFLEEVQRRNDEDEPM
ncbi:hypothetical protein NliqN6_2836 [Naganishia liquefaciens]|uniref:Adhesion regulating molecule n=1 Tax=Naganishia liquefaciens TaxID=104408 RepID=A0A8H3TUK3_9TREE|nr:hypothetical protein NliqN6_2836 [Naganishia liquefaciens]